MKLPVKPARITSGAAVDPSGPAPKGMLANYTVIVTTMPPSRSQPPLPVPRPPASGTRAAAVAVALAAETTYGEEADVRDALVDRDVTESIICRRRYRILPDFGPGDRPYVVSVRSFRCWFLKKL